MAEDSCPSLAVTRQITLENVDVSCPDVNRLWPTRLHAPWTTFKCKFCPYATTHKESFVLHECKHLEGRMFKCRFCSYDSADGANVTRHEMTKHTGKKPYKCSMCAYVARTKCHLTEHLRTHKKY